MIEYFTHPSENKEVKSFLSKVANNIKTDAQLSNDYKAINSTLKFQDKFILLFALLENSKFKLFEEIVEDNNIVLKSLNFAYAKKFRLSKKPKGKLIINKTSLWDSDVASNTNVIQGISYFGLIDIAQLYDCSLGFVKYLLFKGLTPLREKKTIIQIPTSMEGRSIAIDLDYSRAYTPLLSMYNAIQTSGQRLLQENEAWENPIMTILNQDQLHTAELFEFLKAYTAQMIALFAKAHAHIDSRYPIPAKQNEKTIITPHTPWEVIPYFIALVESIIRTAPLAQQIIEYKKWHATDADLILTILDYTKISNAVLAQNLQPIAERWVQERAAVQGYNGTRVLTIKESKARPTFFASDALPAYTNTYTVASLR